MATDTTDEQEQLSPTKREFLYLISSDDEEAERRRAFLDEDYAEAVGRAREMVLQIRQDCERLQKTSREQVQNQREQANEELRKAEEALARAQERVDAAKARLDQLEDEEHAIPQIEDRIGSFLNKGSTGGAFRDIIEIATREERRAAGLID